MKSLLVVLIAYLLLSCSPIQRIENPFEASSRSPVSATSEGVENEDKPQLKIIVIDVGQGDASLIIGPSGRTILIDGGPVDSGVRKVLPLLNDLGITHLDWIVATHYDADHIGGLGEIIKGNDQVMGTDDDLVPSFGVLDRGENTDKNTLTYQNYIDLTSDYRHEAEPGTQIELGNGAQAEVIVVNGQYNDGQSIPLEPDDENEASIGILIHYEKFRYFTAGDLTGGGPSGSRATKDVESGVGKIIGDIDILHVGHHGSLTSTNSSFLDQVMPEEALISVGKDNDYGHPRDEIIDRLEAVGAQIYRTDQIGSIEIQSDGNGFQTSPVY